MRHVESLCDTPVDLDVVLHDRDEVLAAVAAAGLTVAEWYVRSPVGTEADTVRLYLLAHAPA